MDWASVAQVFAGLGIVALLSWAYNRSKETIPGGWIKASDIKPGMCIVGVPGRVRGIYHAHPKGRGHDYLVISTTAKGWLHNGPVYRKPDQMVYRMTEVIKK